MHIGNASTVLKVCIDKEDLAFFKIYLFVVMLTHIPQDFSGTHVLIF